MGGGSAGRNRAKGFERIFDVGAGDFFLFLEEFLDSVTPNQKARIALDIADICVEKEAFLGFFAILFVLDHNILHFGVVEFAKSSKGYDAKEAMMQGSLGSVQPSLQREFALSLKPQTLEIMRAFEGACLAKPWAE